MSQSPNTSTSPKGLASRVREILDAERPALPVATVAARLQIGKKRALEAIAEARQLPSAS